MSNAEIDIDHPTKRQHYVPRLYLKNWCGANARFAVAEDGELRDRETPKGHAYGEFYYEACDLAPDELQYLFTDVSRSFSLLLHNCTSAVFASNGDFLRENNYVPLKIIRRQTLQTSVRY